MKFKRILIVSRAFYPNNSPRSFRSTELAKELARQGHMVTVMFPTQKYDYRSFIEEHKIIIKNLGKLRLKTVVLKGGKLQLLIRKIIARLMLMFFEFPDIEFMFMVASRLKLEKDYDVLISVAAPHSIHWGIAKARRSNHRIARTWIADCGDPYMGDQIDTFKKLFYFKYLEKWFCRKADFITVPIKGALEGYYKEFHDKIRIIPQGFYFFELDRPGIVHNDPIRFAFAGNLIPNRRDPRKLLEYLATLNIDFVFVIFTQKKELLTNYIDKFKGKIEVRNYIPREELLNILKTMDFLINFDNNTKIHSPSKLIDYALTGRPILNITSDLDTKKIDDFLKRDYSLAYYVSNVEQYNITNVASQFLELSKDILE